MQVVLFTTMEYTKLNLPSVRLKTSLSNDGVLRVWDGLRQKYVALTPEEYVRQHFVAWLRDDRHYPESMTANEVGIKLNGTQRRCDSIVFGRDGKPMIIVEYKAPDVRITQDVFDQIVRYNMVLHAQYLIVSNGLNHYCARMDYERDSYHFIPVIPDWNELNTQHDA